MSEVLHSRYANSHVYLGIVAMVYLTLSRGLRLFSWRFAFKTYMCLLLVCRVQAACHRRWILGILLYCVIVLPPSIVLIVLFVGPFPDETGRQKKDESAINNVLQKATPLEVEVCSICDDQFKNSVQLPCDHVLCEQCIRPKVSEAAAFLIAAVTSLSPYNTSSPNHQQRYPPFVQHMTSHRAYLQRQP